MKFIVNSQNLSKQLQLLSGVLSSNSNNVPIINCFHLHLEENELTIKTTGFESTTTVITKIEVDTGMLEGLTEVAIPSKLFMDTLKVMDDGPITIKVDDATYAVEITSESGRYTLAGLNAETYPTLPTITDTVKITMQASSFVTAINTTIFATSNDEMRPQMSGIYCQLNGEGVTFVATDAHKLVRYRRKDVTSEQEAKFILPRKPIALVKSILSSTKEESEVEIEYNATNVTFTSGNYHIICRLIEGAYPNYEAAIPKSNPNKLTLDRESMLNTLRRVCLYASKSTHQVRFIINEREVGILAEDIEFSNNASEKLPCEYEGEPMEIGFNALFLMEMLSNLGSENILIEMSGPNRAGILFPIMTDDDDKNEDILMLLMPMMINS